MRVRSNLILTLAGAILPLAGLAQTAPAPACPQLTTEQVVHHLVRRNLERAQSLPAYSSMRTYRVDYHGFPGSRSAEMVVDVRFDPPSTKTFIIRSQTGSKLIIDKVLKKALESEKEAFEPENQKRTALNNDNYTFVLVGCESPAGVPMYVLEVEPKEKSKFLYRGKIWVDATDFAVSRISAEPAKNPSFWIKQTQIEQHYAKVKDFWLPASNHSATSVRLGGHADFTIEYKDYQLAAMPTSSDGTERSSARR